MSEDDIPINKSGLITVDHHLEILTRVKQELISEFLDDLKQIKHLLYLHTESMLYKRTYVEKVFKKWEEKLK